MKGEGLRFSIVLPCYNEAENLRPILAEYRSMWPDFPAELILVDNGSTDHTSRVLENELPDFPFARVVTVPLNRGYGYGVMAGLRAAQGAVLGLSHADMQCAPADLMRAYSTLLQSGAENTLVKGKRRGRTFGSRLVTSAMSVCATIILGMWLTDINAQPKVFYRSLLDKMHHPPDGFELDLCILHAAKTNAWKIRTIPVIFGERAHGVSKWAFSLASRRKHMQSTFRYICSLSSARFERTRAHGGVIDASGR